MSSKKSIRKSTKLRGKAVFIILRELMQAREGEFYTYKLTRRLIASRTFDKATISRAITKLVEAGYLIPATERDRFKTHFINSEKLFGDFVPMDLAGAGDIGVVAVSDIVKMQRDHSEWESDAPDA